VRAIPGAGHHRVGAPQRLLARERPQQLIVARRRLVHAGQNRVHDMQRRRRRDASGREAGAGTDRSAIRARVLQRTDDGRSHRDDAAVPGAGMIDRERRGDGDVVGLVERQVRVERGVPGGRDAGRVGDRRELDAAGAHRRERVPVEREAGRRRLERDRRTRDRRPYVPQRERRRQVRVLDRPAVPRDAGPDRIGRGVERDRHEARMIERAGDDRGERSEVEPIAPRERRRQRAMFGRRVEVACAEHDRGEVAHLVG